MILGIDSSDDDDVVVVTNIDNSDDDDVVSNISSKKACCSLSQCPISIEIIFVEMIANEKVCLQPRCVTICVGGDSRAQTSST